VKMVPDDSMKPASSALHSTAWCHDSRGAAYSFNQYLEMIISFHGHPAPGLVMGGKMVDLALDAMPDDCLFDAIVETGNCLPDAVSLLTPCTVGNGWLKVFDLGRFALALYDKQTGAGLRVFLHPQKISVWKEISDWFFKRRPKAEQDLGKVLKEMQRAGENILQADKIRVAPSVMAGSSLGKTALCPQCGESYPLKHGNRCRACQGASPYVAE